jgi:hypothetical protein
MPFPAIGETKTTEIEHNTTCSGSGTGRYASPSVRPLTFREDGLMWYRGNDGGWWEWIGVSQRKENITNTCGA